MKKILVFTVLLMSLALSCFAEEARTTVEMYKDPSLKNVKILGDQLRVRTHPDLDGYILTFLSKGTVCKFMNRVDDKNGEDSWIYVILPDGKVGWVFGQYAEVEGGAE